jgi:hypothetical protein
LVRHAEIALDFAPRACIKASKTDPVPQAPDELGHFAPARQQPRFRGSSMIEKEATR